MMLAGGTLNGRRLFSPRLIQFVSRNQTEERIDENFGLPMHRGSGPTFAARHRAFAGLGALASPTTFGHGGAGTSYSWADPESGLSFSYLSNLPAEEPFHSRRTSIGSATWLTPRWSSAEPPQGLEAGEELDGGTD